MAKGNHRRRRKGAGPGPPSADAILADLDARRREIADGDPAAAGPIWGAVHKLLLKTEARPAEAARLIATRDTEGLARLVETLRGGEPTPPAPDDVPAEAGPDVPPETLKKALRAFRKRIKLVRLDHESRLGVGPMTSGRKADFQAILPPQEFPPEVWEALAATGQLRAAGQGFYMLPEGDEGA